MITPDDAMRQAHETAREYAIYAKKAYEDLFDTPINNDRQASATFMAGFMQAASTDFAGWAIQRQLEGVRDNLTRIADISDEGFEDIVSLLSRLPVEE
jgi:hypothetical protein